MIPNEYDFYTTPETYFICPYQSKSVIVIDRISQEVRLQSSEFTLPHSASLIKIYGIWGTIKLISGYYLLVITERETVGQIADQVIWRVKNSALFPFSRSFLNLNDIQTRDEQTYRQMLEFVLSTEGFYYSTTYDITHSQQRLADIGPSLKAKTLFERSDERFTWNRSLLLEWERQLANAYESAVKNKFPSLPNFNRFEFCLPIIQGFVGIICNPAYRSNSSSSISSSSSSVYVLISRRSIYRTGTRFNSRGVDFKGHASNTVETEQILEISGHRFSFVQLRGSVPLFWSQKPNLRYKPSVLLGGSQLARFILARTSEPQLTSKQIPNDLNEIDNGKLDEAQATIVQQHFMQLIYDYGYGRQTIVNLLNQKGLEHQLGHAYAVATLALNETDVKYESFDFHRECGSTNWNRLSILLERLMPELLRSRQFHLDIDKTLVISHQTGTFRSNCIDCLDRTNVIQSILGWCAIEQALIELGILQGPGSNNADASTNSPLARLWPNFGSRYKSIWADNADYCSMQYTGTRALKTDFTRTGKRTVHGMIMDGYHSLIRYYLNNFCDGFRQDSMHLFLGHYQIYNSNGIPKPLTGPGGPRDRDSKKSDHEWRTQFLPLIFSFTLAMSVLCMVFPTVHWTEKGTYALFWGTVSVLSAFAIFTYGDDFVDRPQFFDD